ILVGDGINANDAGEIWHLLDVRFRIPVTMMPLNVFNSADINRYTTIIFPQGSYGSVTETARENLKAWIRNGGVAIGFENAVNWFHTTGLGRFEIRRIEEPQGEKSGRPYSEIERARGAQATRGAILESKVDLTHPLLYGYYRQDLPILKGNNLYMEISPNRYANPIVFTQEPLLSGYISKLNYNKARGASVAGVCALGRGRVIGFTENLAFRAFWFGTNKVLMNAIFYGSFIDPASGR
ncbi:MAG: zinc carboxypeptidase, partial [Bacteroidota bacterium]|nr:zinc carboxypeptidase [Bacteroidota bacterium]